MICFPNAKINLGLRITEKRSDGFHNIETIFYPLAWNEALEIVENNESELEFNLHLSGLPINGSTTDNLLFKAYHLIKAKVSVPHIDVYLHKKLPMGAGLGGGSADAAFFINLINTQFNLGLSKEIKLEIAKQLGSDCAFFIENTPVLATEKGDVFQTIKIDLSHLWIAIIYPNVHSNTQEAYSLVKPQENEKSLVDIISQPIETWKTELKNDFEESIFSKYPIVKQVKTELYKSGALYACMSGSGSAVFGLFENKPSVNELTHFQHWLGKMK
jgi:4-diphosphocytidyl-2-C-methyl-D-erythritol kinase